MTPNDCEHIKVETLYQYDKQKNRTLLWACPECHMLFQPKGLADAEIVAENEKLEENRVDLCVMLKEWQAFVHPVRLKQINEETSQLLEKNMRHSALPAEEETP